VIYNLTSGYVKTGEAFLNCNAQYIQFPRKVTPRMFQSSRGCKPNYILELLVVVSSSLPSSTNEAEVVYSGPLIHAILIHAPNLDIRCSTIPSSKSNA
jgi:hypothetical protein